MWSFFFALAVHATILFALKSGLYEGPEFGITAGDTSVEVALVVAALAEEMIAEPEPEPPVEPPPVEEPPPPPEAMVEPTPLPEPPRRIEPPKPKPVAKKPAPKRGPVGDGSSPIPGTDAITTHTGPVGDLARPGYLRNPHPTYPEAARQAGLQGVVQLRVKVATDGSVASAAITRSSGHPLLDERALSTVRDRWKFKPARVAGLAIASEVIVPIRFTLNR